jgi:serine/threonine-protein kinase HipA
VGGRALTLAAKARIQSPSAPEDVPASPSSCYAASTARAACVFRSVRHEHARANDNETRSYLEFVDALRQYGAAPKEDMRALWRRIVLSILVSNTDDHLRNHGFLYAGPDGWRLAPAYDLNPVPTDIKPRVLTTAIDLEDGTASLSRAMEGGGARACAKVAREIAAEVGQAVATWRDEAARLGLTEAEIDRMASAFEHEDLQGALKLRSRVGKADG